ncbi:hypothetical protein BGZ96_003453 [Linnemannia gamsii]|uniref:Uncharacterized protein n=1 Tax=Linnemannia gamsii TaxID=64522 RepID=A0ABQ7JJE1_9FUNG|nr:hypothetical protein BGZ96_003453 [Linnemannia gamsii]
MTRYHDPRPVFIPNPIAGRPPLKIQRDPARRMCYPCPHPKCDHISILKTDPRQHQLVCEYRDRTRFNRPPAPDPGAPKRRRAAASSPSGKRRARTNNDISGVTLDQILATMNQLTYTVMGLDKELDVQTEGIDAIGEQMDWLIDQIDQIRSKNANLEVRAESLRIDAGLVEDHLRDLLEESRNVKEQFRSVLGDIERMRAMTKDL